MLICIVIIKKHWTSCEDVQTGREQYVNHLNDSTRLKMLNCEYGGMNDVLANIYAFTGNKKYLASVI